MPRPRVSIEDQEAIEEIWKGDKKLSAEKIRTQFKTDHGEVGAPSGRWISEHLRPLRLKEQNSQEETAVKPWDQWTNDPEKIRTFFAVHRVATNVCNKYAIDDFVGLTARQNNWVEKLRPFFNLSDYFETAWLLDFAIGFADDEKFARDMGRRFTPRVVATNLLAKWQWRSGEWPQAKQQTTPAPWEMMDEDVEQRIAIVLCYKPPVYRPPKEPPVEQATQTLEELRPQGLPIDEDHASLGMDYTNPEEKEVEDDDQL